MLIGVEVRYYGKQKLMVVIQVIRHYDRQKNLFLVSFETGVQFYARILAWGVLDTYGKIWEHESIIKEKQMDDEQRLAYHQTHSLPIMISIRDWAQKKVASDSFEEYSGLGKAIRYFLKYYNELIMFCTTLGAPIDNNRMEEKLKIVIRGRKTSHFYKTVNGAGVANVLISLIVS